MGKGDPGTRRGKIFKKSYGKKRPKGGRRAKKSAAPAAAAG
jgi:ribosomal small subunit protein bTHX